MSEAKFAININLDSIIYNSRYMIPTDVHIKHPRKQKAPVFLRSQLFMMSTNIRHIITVKAQYCIFIVIHKTVQDITYRFKHLDTNSFSSGNAHQRHIIKRQCQSQRVCRKRTQSFSIIIRKGDH